jgi:hypothetical protein
LRQGVSLSMTSRRKDHDAQAAQRHHDLRADVKVFISHRDSTCDECHHELGHGAWIVPVGERGAICLTCADLDHLTFLPAGDTALTRRAKKRSRLSAVVLNFSRARRRYERQGLLVEEAALAQAEAECLADEQLRQRRKVRETERRDQLDERYVAQFAEFVRALFPVCPLGRERTIAEHACCKYSGRVGRSAAAKELREDAIRVAVVAHIRHVETNYDELLGLGHDRSEARRLVADQVDRVLQSWTGVAAGASLDR